MPCLASMLQSSRVGPVSCYSSSFLNHLQLFLFMRLDRLEEYRVGVQVICSIREGGNIRNVLSYFRKYVGSRYF